MVLVIAKAGAVIFGLVSAVLWICAARAEVLHRLDNNGRSNTGAAVVWVTKSGRRIDLTRTVRRQGIFNAYAAGAAALAAVCGAFAFLQGG